MIDEKLFSKGLFCPRCFYMEAGSRQAPDGFHAVDIEELLDEYFEGADRLDAESTDDWLARSETRFKGKGTFRRGLFRWQDCVVHLDACIAQTKNRRSAICLTESKRVKKQTFWELAYQKHVLAQLGLELERTYVLYFNKHYRLEGTVNPHELLILADVSEEVEEFVPLVAEQLTRMQRILAGPEPVLALAPYQDKDIACSLTSECYSFPTDHPATVHGIAPAKLVKIVRAGYQTVQEVPDHLLSAKGRIQKRTVLEKRAHLERVAVEKKLAEIKEPVSALDFEAFSPMIPQFQGDGVHLPIVYQCSVAYEDPDGVQAGSYVYQGQDDPRDGVMQALLRMLPEEGSILVYNQGFERARLRELEARYPEHKTFLKSLQQRLVDLLPLFSSFLVYHPAQQGSTKLKHVARAFRPGSYGDSSVADGKMAQDLYERYRLETDPEERETILRDLANYGQWDAKVLVELYRVLKSRVRASE